MPAQRTNYSQVNAEFFTGLRRMTVQHRIAVCPKPGTKSRPGCPHAVSLVVRQNAAPIRRLLDRYDRLVMQARATLARMVLTHGELHPGHTMLTADGSWLFIGWDTALVAPPERDLWSLDPGDWTVLDAYAAYLFRIGDVFNGELEGIDGHAGTPFIGWRLGGHAPRRPHLTRAPRSCHQCGSSGLTGASGGLGSTGTTAWGSAATTQIPGSTVSRGGAGRRMPHHRPRPGSRRGYPPGPGARGR